MRYLIAVNCDISTAKKDYADFAPMLDEKTLELCNNKCFNFDEQETLFNYVFDILTNLPEIDKEDVFKKFSGKFSGAVLSSSFLVITVGMAKSIMKSKNTDFSFDLVDLCNKIKNLYRQEKFIKFTGNGIRAVDRYVNFVPFGEEYFSNESQNG